MGKKKQTYKRNRQLPTQDQYEQSDQRNLIKSPTYRISQAQQVLQATNNPSKFKFRQRQIQIIQMSISKLMNHQKSKKSRIIMLTGMPGAGKTLCANFVLQNSGYKVISFNANQIQKKSDVQSILIDQLIPQEKKKNQGEISSFQLINLLAQANIPQTVLYIEQIQLFFKNKMNQIYQDFFQLFTRKKLPLVLIGISNTIDALYTYGKQMKIEVQDIMNVVFNPYSVQEVKKIIQWKLDQVQKVSGIKIIINERLLTFASNKMHQYKKGDLRIVFTFLHSLGEEVLLPSKVNEQINITIDQVNRAISTTKKQTNRILLTLPLNQKIILIAVYNCIKQRDSTHLTLKQLSDQVKQIYQLMNIKKKEAFKQELQQLDMYGFIKIKISKLTNEKRILLGNVEVDEIKYGFEDDQLLTKFIKV